MNHLITESEIEELTLDLIRGNGCEVLYGPDISPDGSSCERADYSEITLTRRLRDAVCRLNPFIPEDAREEALRKVLRTPSPDILTNNYQFHRMLTEGIDVQYKNADGNIRGDKVRLIDFDNPDNNEFLAVNQFTIIENHNNRRPDVILFVNGLPLVIFELKNAADESATIWSAFNQIETYKHQIPSLFTYNEIIIISDGLEARMGTISSDKERFMPWKTIDGEKLEAAIIPGIDVTVKGMLKKEVFLDLIRNFIVFEEDKTTIKKIAAYHQYHAVNKAYNSTYNAVGPAGDKRCGVIWHTQGSGKSLTMVFYTGKLVLSLDNPTIVVITDRNDLDDQLFGTFSRCRDLLRQTPVQAKDREDLRELLKVASGGVVFTTVHKFFPEKDEAKFPLLSDRRNIVVIADEAHRSQYDFVDGFARHMRDALPNASFIGFTGTPIETTDKNTVAVFGNHIDVYDIEQAVKDGATVRIFYESRLAKLELKEEEKPKIDPDFEEVTEGQEIDKKERLKSKWARLEAVVGSEKRIRAIANDIVTHFERRLGVLEGKGMIVCMSRRICIDLYNEIIKLRPEWHNADDDKGTLKVIMTGSATDPVSWQDHIRNKQRREELANKFKDPTTPFKLVIVRDMWLTGFDAPCLHTMYMDKPMRSHGLMQAIARVNRVFKNKPGGLIVDYLGIADDLKKALMQYTENGGKGRPTFNQEDAVAVLLEKYEIVSQMFHGFDYNRIFNAPISAKMGIILEAAEFILNQDDGKTRYLQHVAELSKAFALSVPNEAALEIQDEVGFFQSVKAAIIKNGGTNGKSDDEIESAIKQIVSKAVAVGEVIDIFESAGLKKPDISILSDEFLAEVKDLPQKNLAFELLKKLLNDEIKVRSKRNLIQSRSFAQLLEEAIRKYQNKAIEVAELIEHLIELARDMREANKRGEKLGLTEDELAFYDALEVNDSAVKVLGDEVLRKIAHELVDMIRKNVTIDWTLRESVQARLRSYIKRVLRKYGYPPDKQEKATETVIEQATLLCKDWAESNA
ncbi:MAG: type I restriction endonuclease subunit R [Acidobacteriota bacterium]